ncbi:MAG: CHRD domain-containing protein [Dehalococcoidia bacterium]
MTRRIFAIVPLTLAALILSLGGLGTQPASAATHNLVATIDRAQAATTCPGAGPGTGMGTMTYNDVSNELSWNITFSGMSAIPPTSAHFHGPAAPGSDAVIQVTIGDLTSPSVGMATITETQEGQLLSDLWYINYHSLMCGGGEIRGQVVPAAAVGGIAELPDVAAAPLQQTDDASGMNGALIAGLTALAIVVVTAGVTGVLAARRHDQS